MPKSETDAKNVELLKLIFQLRAHVDIHRIIGLNGDALCASRMGAAFVGYLQKSAHEALAIYICKIFEPSGQYELNSIPAIIKSLSAYTLSERQNRDFADFGHKYGQHAPPVGVVPYLDETFRLFCNLHANSLCCLKEFRDTIGAHSDSKAAINALPSHVEFESLFSFANDFYQLITRSILGSSPATIPQDVGRNFIALMKTIGIRNPRFDFDADR
ncbi:MAG: hypothetical protein WCC11_08710 [Gammaproteobacteria bacterium]